jgi:hypothetical protein
MGEGGLLDWESTTVRKPKHSTPMALKGLGVASTGGDAGATPALSLSLT